MTWLTYALILAAGFLGSRLFSPKLPPIPGPGPNVPAPAPGPLSPLVPAPPSLFPNNPVLDALVKQLLAKIEAEINVALQDVLGRILPAKEVPPPPAPAVK